MSDQSAPEAAPGALQEHSGNTLGCSGLLREQLRAARGLTQLGSGSRSLPEAAVLPSLILLFWFLYYIKQSCLNSDLMIVQLSGIQELCTRRSLSEVLLKVGSL